jgi:GT2 family glycosyltransferase
MNASSTATAVRLFAVVVLYHTTPVNSKAFQSLQDALRRLPPGHLDLNILLYDNTPGGQDAGVLPADVQYKADFENSGLAKAYNYALKIAQEEGFDWLLTLDQDTSLPIDFLSKLCHAIAFVSPLRTVAAIVPICGGRAGSPWIRRKYWIRPKRFPDGFIGIPLERVYAVNSASTIRVSALEAIGGYDLRFSIWASDLVMYHRLHCNHFSVFVAGDIRVEHESSIADLKNRSTPNRYEDMLRAEEAFYDEYMGRRGHIVLLLIMFHRLVYRLWTTGGSLPYVKIVLRFLCRGLFYSRKHRMESWKQAVRRR